MSCPRSLSNAIKDLTIPPNDLFPQSTIKFAHAHLSSVYVCPEIKSRKCTSDKKSLTGRLDGSLCCGDGGAERNGTERRTRPRNGMSELTSAFRA